MTNSIPHNELHHILQSKLCNFFADLLKQSQPARIVIVASELYKFAFNFNMNMINPVNFWFPGYLYYYSKFANILFSLELARKLENTSKFFV